MKTVSISLSIAGIIMLSLGGVSDLTGKKVLISKEHYWIDGISLLLLAILFK